MEPTTTDTGVQIGIPSSRERAGIVVFGDVVRSRARPEASTAWLRRLVALLDDAYAGQRLAPFAFTQGDEIQGLLCLDADPFRAVLVAGLDAERLAMRWMIAAGPIVPGEGPATERTGDAFIAARGGLQRLSVAREAVGAISGDGRADRLLGNLAPLLGELLGDLSDRQRVVARLALLDGCRQAEIAARLSVSPATVSVIAARARVRSIARLADALREVFAEGIAADADQSAAPRAG